MLYGLEGSTRDDAGKRYGQEGRGGVAGGVILVGIGMLALTGWW